jgi:opacity protein-like surface antigen
MKQIKMTALAIALTGIASGTALAQSKANAWEGAYGQIGVGYGNFAPSIDNGTAQIPTGRPAPYPSSLAGTTSATNVNNINTGLVNLAVGYNFGINADYVLGIGASYYPGASTSATGTLNTLYNGNTLGSTTATYNVKNLFNVFLSPGYVIDKDRMAYLKVGYTGATIGLSSPVLAYTSTNLTGYTLGLGYKQMITQSLYVLGEFNYASYGSQTASATTTTGVAVSNSIKGTGMDLLVGLGYRF